MNVNNPVVAAAALNSGWICGFCFYPVFLGLRLPDRFLLSHILALLTPGIVTRTASIWPLDGLSFFYPVRGIVGSWTEDRKRYVYNDAINKPSIGEAPQWW